MEYKIGTRGSKLAVIQAEYVCERLQAAYPNDHFSIKQITTKGDKIQNRPLDQLGDKGVFVKEIEEEILRGEVQIGVHSMKDMPSDNPDGLCFTKPWKREDPRDVLILREKASLMDLPKHARIGTGSKRRGFQLLSIRPDLEIVPIRGNVDTRIKKMKDQKLDGLVLAAAGLKRLSMESIVSQYLTIEEMIPAPAQGILALQVCKSNVGLIHMLNELADQESTYAANAERGFLKEIGGDCHIPVGAYCQQMDYNQFRLTTLYGNENGSKMVRTTLVGQNPQELGVAAACETRKKYAGTVSLVGAGPGDPGLITIKGIDAVKNADCILYDRLIAPELLGECKSSCELIYVGKENHHHTLTQEEINRLLVEKSMVYDSVVRLKGGDNYVFGRGGEEGLYLEEKGVPFVVVPGITSAIAGLAYAGIPITHRGIATGFHVVTGHNSQDELTDIDFHSMALGRDTCVFLMGLSNIEKIVANLMKEGMSKDMEVAVISNATTPFQQVCVAPLEKIVHQVKINKLQSPGIIVIGHVVSLRDKLNFFENNLFFGKKYLIPKIGNEKTVITRKLEQGGAVVTEIQVGKIERKSVQLQNEECQKVNWIIFTSKNGVKAFFQNCNDQKIDLRTFSAVKFAAIGRGTSQCLQEYGFFADFVPTEFNGNVMAQQLLSQIKPEDLVWFFRPEDTDSDLSKILMGHCILKEYIIYQNQNLEMKNPLDDGLSHYDGVVFTCGSSAKRILELIPADIIREWNQKGNCFAIGPKTQEVLHHYGITNIHLSEEATYDSLYQKICSFVK